MTKAETSQESDAGEAKKVQWPAWWKIAIALASLPITYGPLLVLLIWELTEKPIRGAIKLYNRIKWKNLAKTIGYVYKDVAESKFGHAIAAVANLRIPRFFLNETAQIVRECGRSIDSFAKTFQNSGRWGGTLGASVMFAAFVGISIFSAGSKIPLLIGEWPLVAQFLLNTAPEWLINHSPAVINNTVLPLWNFASAGVSLLAKPFMNLSLHLNPLDLLHVKMPEWMTIGDTWVKTHTPNWIPYGKTPVIGPALDLFIGTPEVALKTAAWAAVAAKAIKPIVGPLYWLTPQMQQEPIYRATWSYLAFLGRASLAATRFFASPFRLAFDLYKASLLPKIIKAPFVLPLNLYKTWRASRGGKPEGLLSKTVGVFTALPKAIAARTHHYLSQKAQQAGGLLKTEEELNHHHENHAPQRTFFGDMKHVFQHPLQTGAKLIRAARNSVPATITSAVVVASGYAAFTGLLPLAWALGLAYVGIRASGAVRSFVGVDIETRRAQGTDVQKKRDYAAAAVAPAQQPTITGPSPSPLTASPAIATAPARSHFDSGIPTANTNQKPGLPTTRAARLKRVLGL